MRRGGIAKVDPGLAKGRKKGDKREHLKKQDWQRDKARLVREKGEKRPARPGRARPVDAETRLRLRSGCRREALVSEATAVQAFTAALSCASTSENIASVSRPVFVL